MVKEQVFTRSEKRVISAMYQLDRWATANEIAEWAEKMSWNTAEGVLKVLKTKGVVQSEKVKGRIYWKLIDLN